jgi:hypothetical protein
MMRYFYYSFEIKGKSEERTTFFFEEFCLCGGQKQKNEKKKKFSIIFFDFNDFFSSTFVFLVFLPCSFFSTVLGSTVRAFSISVFSVFGSSTAANSRNHKSQHTRTSFFFTQKTINIIVYSSLFGLPTKERARSTGAREEEEKGERKSAVQFPRRFLEIEREREKKKKVSSTSSSSLVSPKSTLSRA